MSEEPAQVPQEPLPVPPKPTQSVEARVLLRRSQRQRPLNRERPGLQKAKSGVLAPRDKNRRRGRKGQRPEGEKLEAQGKNGPFIA